MLISLSQFLWGPPLEQYTSAYGIGAARHRETHGTIPRQLASAAVRRICDFSGQVGSGLSYIEVAEKVSLATLIAVMRMSHDPDTYKIFLSPGLASGCVELMATVKEGGKTVPFSYEYGYLCFRILLFSLGACILSRSGDSNLDKTINMMKDPRYGICLISDLFSLRIAQRLVKLIPVPPQPAECDWILGWGSSATPSRHDQIVSREQARKLIDMLWEDRINFSQAMSSTFIPGLAGLLFLNWRYICLENTSTNPNNSLLKQTCELQWRCQLVIPTNQEDPAERITDHFWVSTKFDPRKGDFFFNRSKDSRWILEAYIVRLAPINLAMYDALPLTMLHVLLQLVAPNLVTDVEDLLPSIFKVTLCRLWKALREEECTYEPTILCIALTFEQFRTMFKSLRENGISPPTIARILEELAQQSFLDLVASLFLSLDPNAEIDSKEDITNFNLIQTTKAMIDELEMSTPSELAEIHFQDYAMAWHKTNHHFAHLQHPIMISNGQAEHRLRENHYKASLAVKLGIGNEGHIVGIVAD
ncbi:unnamed protein product [Rhizoctonia solani]|uniref:Uncharacterized protein n=1 Tax=Rhizoctonia solani TaxID=456999 RepID=A0A8H3DWI6_9AGAM|nr:unnamed protein product [Rhizoctonia solani]